ncbi:MAG: alpha/beta hydrolase [Pigmentiphaga sp.]|uniref:alpha/beta fold hydrolase n=1 Tax=Pigmentiphaga sp. TaxID=1977564 RepID=UPI0029B026B6|nr:alpha/beta hydrolase [Pigmentiphaga sp.]MDX3907417.1 alpha/beta hydrolase [Pigmentiphaga sp.]
MRAAFVTLEGLQTRYLMAGSGPLLVLVHPIGYPADVFRRNIDALAGRFTVVAPDLPGQGYSQGPAGWTQPPQVSAARHVLALATHLGFDVLSIAGSSLGGLVAAMAALQAPSRVQDLVLIGTGSVFNDPAGQPAVLETVYANGSRVYRDPDTETLRARIANTCFRPPEADDILAAHLTAYALPGAADHYQAMMEALSASMADPDATAYPHLERIRARTLIIIGRDDSRTSYASHHAGASRMADARLLVFDECGHLPFLEHPAAFNDAVLRFLAGDDVGDRP